MTTFNENVCLNMFNHVEDYLCWHAAIVEESSYSGYKINGMKISRRKQKYSVQCFCINQYGNPYYTRTYEIREDRIPREILMWLIRHNNEGIIRNNE